MPVTETILRKRIGLPFCVLGDLSSTPPGFGSSSFRPIVDASGQNREYGQDYPSTTPEQIMRKVRGYNGVSNCPGPAPKLYGVLTGGVMTNQVSSGFPPSPIAGSPFSADDRGLGTSIIYPRWTGETAYNWDTSGAGYLFTPDDWPDTTSAFDYLNGLTDTTNGKSIAMSYATGFQPNDPSIGGDTAYQYDSYISIYMDATEASCWNDGAQIEINLDIWKVDLTLTYVSGTYGQHTFTYGTRSYDSTLTQTVTLDATNCSGAPYKITDWIIPVGTAGYLTYLDDFYITSVTAP